MLTLRMLLNPSQYQTAQTEMGFLPGPENQTEILCRNLATKKKFKLLLERALIPTSQMESPSPSPSPPPTP